MCGRRTGKGLRNKQRGAALVEFAIVAFLLCVLVFGMIDFGIWLWQYHSVSEVARQAARIASVGGSPNIPDLAEQMGLVSANLTVSTYDVPATAGQPITVALAYSHPSIAGGLLDFVLPNPMETTIIYRRE